MGIQRRHQLEASQQISALDLTYKLDTKATKKVPTKPLPVPTKRSLRFDIIKTLGVGVIIVGIILLIAWKM